MLDLRRRQFIALLGGAATWPLAARAQQSAMPVVGFLNGASYQLSAFLVQAFHRGLAETGFAEGRNVAFEYRSAEGQYSRLPALAADLVARNVNVIAAAGTPTGLPAKTATSTIPVVFVTGSDPVEQGLVVSLNHPSSNLTGATTLAVELGQKRMQLLREMVPSATFVAVLVNQKGPNLASVSRDLEGAARTLDLPMRVVQASNDAELDSAFVSLAEMQAKALVIGTDTFFNSKSARLAELALRHRVPAVYQYREFVAAGGLMSYAGSITDAYRVAGTYTGRILKGEKPADLPVQQSTKAELFINLKTARAFGLDVPPTLLARADEVIE
jgi:putative ABC transport system substrate-binding protein